MRNGVSMKVKGWGIAVFVLRVIERVAWFGFCGLLVLHVGGVEFLHTVLRASITEAGVGKFIMEGGIGSTWREASDRPGVLGWMDRRS